MKEDPRNHTLWKHKGSWHNRGTMWDNLVTEWAKNKDLMKKRSEKNTIDDKRNCETFVLGKMNLCASTEKEKREVRK